jgi:hypothetical protein
VERPPGADDFASGVFAFPLTPVDAEQILVRTRIFAFGEMPPKRQVQAFNVLMDLPDAVVRFRRILPQAKPAGELYAFAALTTLAPSEAEPLARTLSARQDQLLVYNSDVVQNSSVRDMMTLILTRHVVEEWRARRESTNEYFREVASRPTPAASGGRTRH